MMKRHEYGQAHLNENLCVLIMVIAFGLVILSETIPEYVGSTALFLASVLRFWNAPGIE